MKIKPVILCGGAGTRLWKNFKSGQAKQFINFGNWTLFGKTLERIKEPIFSYPIISTNFKYIKNVKKHLKLHKIQKYKIILEPIKKNTAPAILSAALLNDIPDHQPIIFLSSDHLIENVKKFNKTLKNNMKYLNDKNIFLFGIKPSFPSDQYGYIISKKINKNLNRVLKFVEKPDQKKAEKIIKRGGSWNCGIFFSRKDSIINNFKKYNKVMYSNCTQAVRKAKIKKNIVFLNKKSFNKNSSKSFDYAILEKSKNINTVKIDISWSDLGNWKEICLMYNRNKSKYFKKRNTFYRPWGSYTNLFYGKYFLIKEIYVKPKGVLSLQKHFHRSEHWVIVKGSPKITLNNKFYIKKPYETIYIPKGSIHRIENPNNKPIKIIEAQLGSILKETDIFRFEDKYGRAN